MTLATAPARPLRIGPIDLDVPVVLAPMAGITNTAFRRLCREYGAGLYVSEMITSRALVERNETTMRLIRHHESETPRSIQLYGVDPKTIAEAVRIIVAEDHADHIDLNFGCPVPKVTRRGGGAALPWKSKLFADIVDQAVKAAGGRAAHGEERKGIDRDHLTFLDAGRAAEDAGAAAVALHARTASEFYSGFADWNAIGELKQAVTSIPVLGNGDVWSADDAVRMMAQTDCDGVVVGRGCLGRPWLFGELATAFGGEGKTVDATLGFVANAFRRHAELLVEFFEDEDRGCPRCAQARVLVLQGGIRSAATSARGSPPRPASRRSTTSSGASTTPRRTRARMPEGQRGRSGHPKRTALPDKWLESRELASSASEMMRGAEIENSGG